MTKVKERNSNALQKNLEDLYREQKRKQLLNKKSRKGLSNKYDFLKRNISKKDDIDS